MSSISSSPHPNFKPFLAYSASAGSGKTFALSVRYISLLFMGESPNSILAATFTNKAASEMRQRVVDSLRMLDAEGSRAFVDAVLLQTGLGREELLARQPEVLSRFLSSATHIVTLDSFFSSILRSASMELGLEPDFMTKDHSGDELERYFLDDVESAGLLSSLVRLAIDIEDRRFGKIFDLMQSFYKLDPLLPEQQKLQHSIKSLEDEIDGLRRDMIDKLLEVNSAQRCIKQFETNSTKELSAKTLFQKSTLGEHSWFKKSANEEIESIYAEMKQALRLWSEARESVVLHNLFGIYDYYKSATISNAKSSNILSFDDLTYFTYRLLHESISREFLYFKLDSRFKHILLDEFQDTSTLQLLLLKPLIDEIFSGHGQSEFKSFFYVGDTKQSLYRFRGGVEELFDRVAQNYGIDIEQMDTNYRSSMSVVEQVNDWFESTMDGYVRQHYRDGASKGLVEVIESDEPIAEAITQAQKLLDAGVSIDEIAFLVNTNRDGQTLHESSQLNGIDTLLKTSSSLKNRPKIAALVGMVSYLFYGERIDAEAMLIKVGKTIESIDTSWFSAFMSPLHVIDRLVREFGYFDSDPNILKLLEFAALFADIPTLLEEFDDSSIPVATSSIHGAKIMTIHGSKGLEFEYVILLDKLTRPNSDKATLIYHYGDNLHIDRILYRSKGRENFDTEYSSIMEQRKASMQKDRKNILYVALTRAVEGLIVIKKPKESIFDQIGISTMSRGSVTTKQEPKIQSLEEHPAVAISDYGTQEITAKESDGDKDYAAIAFGTALHYGLEMLGEFDEMSLELAMTAVQNRYGQLIPAQKLAEIEHRIASLIRHEPFLEILRDARVSKEQSLSFDGELKQIDLLLEYDEHYLVVDYKSSKKYSLKHQSQVSHYKKAIQKITGKRVDGMILYLLESGIEMHTL